MERMSKKSRGKESPVVADESQPVPSFSTSTFNGVRKVSASEPQSGSRRETWSSTAKEAKVNETDKVKDSAKRKDNNRTGHEVLGPPTKKPRYSGALGSRDNAEISNVNNSQLHQNLFPFPTETYEMIFKELKGPHLQDLHNVSNATPQWRKLLKKDRVLFLFPKVFEILVQQEVTDFLPTPYHYNEQDTFFMYDVRLVCKSWNESIQNYIQLHPRHLYLEPFETGRVRTIPDEREWIYSVDYQRIEEVYTFLDTGDITKFMEKHRSTHSSEHNPFFGRLVNIQGWGIDGAEQEEFWNAVRNLLLTYGKHIYYFNVGFNDAMTPLEFYQLLHRMLSLLPNIKTLRIDYNDEEDQDMYDGERRQIIREIRSRVTPLSKLANLQVLETSNLPDVLFHHLLQRNDHVKELKVQISRGLPIRLSRMFKQVAMSHEFETLHMSLRSRGDIRDLQTTLGATPAWPLKSLFLSFCPREDADDEALFPVDGWPKWSSIFRLIDEKFGETLLNLTIRLPKAEWGQDRKLLRDAAFTLRLNVPRLRELTVEIPNLISVDFLLGVKDTLEELKIQVTYSDQLSVEDRRREKIKFNGNFEKMEKSNIWDVLPKLKKLLIQVYRNNRSRWGSRGYLSLSGSYSYARTKSEGITKFTKNKFIFN